MIDFSVSLFNSVCQRAVEQYDRLVYKTYTNKGFIEHLAEIDGNQIHYFDNQKKQVPTIVFIHGFGGDGKLAWEEQVKLIKDNYRVIVPDLLWFGQSHSNSKPTLINQVEAINSLIKHLKISKFHLVGISYGGFVSLAFSHLYFKKLKSISVVASPGTIIEDQEIEKFCSRNNVSNVKEIFVPKSSEQVKRLFKLTFINPPKYPMFIYEAIYHKYFVRNQREKEQLLDNLSTNKGSYTEKPLVPALIFWGKKDQVFSVENATKLAQKLNAKTIIHKSTGHMYPGDAAKHFNENLFKFIDEVENTN